MSKDKDEAKRLRDENRKDQDFIDDHTKGGKRVFRDGIDKTAEAVDAARSRVERFDPLADAYEDRDGGEKP